MTHKKTPRSLDPEHQSDETIRANIEGLRAWKLETCDHGRRARLQERINTLEGVLAKRG